MAATTFTWYPDQGSSQEQKPTVTVTKFGDGYEARIPSGINTMPQKWTLTFDRTRTECLSILAFLRARAGAEAFNWTTPLSELGTYVCREWKTNQTPGGMKVDATFEQVFDL